MTERMDEVGRQVAESMLRWVELPLTEDFVRAAYNLSGFAPSKLSDEKHKQADEERRQYRRRTILAELAKLQGNADGSAGTIASG